MRRTYLLFFKVLLIQTSPQSSLWDCPLIKKLISLSIFLNLSISPLYGLSVSLWDCSLIKKLISLPISLNLSQPIHHPSLPNHSPPPSSPLLKKVSHPLTCERQHKKNHKLWSLQRFHVDQCYCHKQNCYHAFPFSSKKLLVINFQTSFPTSNPPILSINIT